jgi:hypothetical protein
VVTVGMPNLQPMPNLDMVPSPVHETKPDAAGSKPVASMKKSRKQTRKSW